MIEYSLERCPICGKKPKVKIQDWSYNGMGAYVTIRCKPFLRKEHLSVMCGKATLDRAIQYAVEDWNNTTN